MPGKSRYPGRTCWNSGFLGRSPQPGLPRSTRGATASPAPGWGGDNGWGRLLPPPAPPTAGHARRQLSRGAEPRRARAWGEVCRAGVRGEREGDSERAGQLCLRSAGATGWPGSHSRPEGPGTTRCGDPRKPGPSRSLEPRVRSRREPRDPDEHKPGELGGGEVWVRHFVLEGVPPPLALSRPPLGFLLPGFLPRRRWTDRGPAQARPP